MAHKHESILQKSANQVNKTLSSRTVILPPVKKVSNALLIQREVRCQLLLATLQNNRVGSAIEPGHVDGVARCVVGIDHVVNNYLTCLVFNHQFSLTNRLTPLNGDLRTNYRCRQRCRRYCRQRQG